MKLAAIVLLVAGTALAQRGHAGAHAVGGRSRYVAPPLASHPVHARSVIVPYPVYYGYGYYGYDPSIPLDAQSAPAYDADPNSYASGYGSQSPSPVVVINAELPPG